MEESTNTTTDKEQQIIEKTIFEKCNLIYNCVIENFEVTSWAGYLAAINCLCATLVALIYQSMKNPTGKQGMINYCVKVIKYNFKEFQARNDLENTDRR